MEREAARWRGAGVGVRVGERRKRAKKVFDPSENNLPSKRKRGRPAGSLNKATLKRQGSGGAARGPGDSDASSERDEPSGQDKGPICTVCRRGGTEKLVGCRDCSNKAHPSCLRGDGMLRLRPDNTWQCPLCKTCVVCIETADAGALTVCSACSDAYHALCHSPRIPDGANAWSQWECRNCSEANAPSSKASDGSESAGDGRRDERSRSPDWSRGDESREAFVSDFPSDGVFVEHPYYADRSVDASIPDAREWTVDEVHRYFSQYFPEHAHVFKEMQIDGRALMVMRRYDAVRNLRLCLGPAVKMYRHVVKLQSRRDDIKMCWF